MHLSDIHFSSPSLDPCLDRLLKYVRKNRNKFRGKIDFIVVSGDVARKGLPEEFNSCRDLFFEELNKILNIKDFSRYLFVCGNHDVQRDVLRESLKGFVQEYLEGDENFSETERKDILSDHAKYKKYFSFKDVKKDLKTSCDQACDLESRHVEHRSSKLLDKYFKSSILPYIEFVSKLKGYKPYKNLITEKYPTHWSKWVFGHRKETLGNGLKVNFFGFNSSWFCVGNDNGNLFLLHELINFPKRKRLKDPTISILHHPPSWLQWSERNAESGVPAFGKILDLSDVILVGHEHDRHVQAPSYYGSQTLLVSSGSTLEADSKHPNNIKILQLHLEDQKSIVKHLSYDSLVYHPNAAVEHEKKWIFVEGDKGYPFEMPTIEVEYSERDFWAGESVTIGDNRITEADRRRFVVENYINGFGNSESDIEETDLGIYQEKKVHESQPRTLFIPFDLAEFEENREAIRFESLYSIANGQTSFVVLLPYHINRRDIKVDQIMQGVFKNVVRKFGAWDDVHLSSPLFITNSEVDEGALIVIPQRMIDKKLTEYYDKTA